MRIAELDSRIRALRDEIDRVPTQDQWQWRAEELERLVRERIFCAREQWQRQDYRPVPTFTYSLPHGAMEGTDGLRTFMRTFAGAVDLEMRRPGAELTFVVLLRVTTDERGNEYSLISPYARPFELLHDLRGPMRERLGERAVALDLELRFALPPDIFTPVVVAAAPDSDTVTFFNKHHFTNPGQFLSPEVGRTTSGLLNCIGALEIQQANDAMEPIRVDTVQALDAGAHEWLRWLYWSMVTGSSLESDRLLVCASDPERYVFDYDGEGL